MAEISEATPSPSRSLAWMPGLRTVRTYRREWLASDVLAGVSVVAAALPIGIAYARLAGFPPVVGIFTRPSSLGGVRPLRSHLPTVHAGVQAFLAAQSSVNHLS